MKTAIRTFALLVAITGLIAASVPASTAHAIPVHQSVTPHTGLLAIPGLPCPTCAVNQ